MLPRRRESFCSSWGSSGSGVLPAGGGVGWFRGRMGTRGKIGIDDPNDMISGISVRWAWVAQLFEVWYDASFEFDRR